MKKYLKTILLTAVLIFGFLVIQNAFGGSNKDGGNTTQDNFANLRIYKGSAQESYDISDFVGKTALEATESRVKVEANGTGVNAFVTSIGGQIADTKKHEFWEFNVNGKQAEVGAGSYIIKNHDEIEWKISNY